MRTVRTPAARELDSDDDEWQPPVCWLRFPRRPQREAVKVLKEAPRAGPPAAREHRGPRRIHG